MNKTFLWGEAPYEVQFTANVVGDDIVVIVSGGEKPHVGAVAISLPRPSLADPSVNSSSTSVFTLTGHKEDDLAKTLAAKIAASLKKNVVLTAGIHLDDISGDGIKQIQNNCQKAADQLIKEFTS